LKRTHTLRVFAGTCLLTMASLTYGQAPAADAPAAPAAPMPPSSPSMSGPLADQPSAMFDAGPFGKLAVNGFLSGFGMVQSNHIPGDDNKQAALSNGQLVIQKTDGTFQFYLQAGGYNLPSLGVPFFTTNDTVSGLFGPLPVAYAKIQMGKNTSFQIGELPTLIGAEYTFSFQNMNVERGLLWNLEPAVSRGIQLNQTMGKVTASFSWNDGFYSSRYSWLSGSLAYSNGTHALAFVGAGNAGQTAYTTFASSVLNNSKIYNVIYTYTKGPWIIQPYFQYTDTPTNKSIGVVDGASTKGFAILASYATKSGFSLPVRFEYLTSSGSVKNGSVNVLFGQGSGATSFTFTPTYQKGGFFVRGDISFTHAMDLVPGYGFGDKGNDASQFRAMAEIGFIFGDNIMKK
jgi:Putative beta-barrel porin-2, OmpL-like. bbp2